MKRRDKKEKYIHHNHRGETAQNLMKRFDLEMKMARKQPKIFYSQEGEIKNVK